MDEMKDIKRFSKFTVRRGTVVQIITNNYCNLHCEWCSFKCHTPSPQWTMTAKEAQLFCERFEGHYTDSVHKFLGGETTAMPPAKLYALIDVFTEHNRKTKILSNGFNIFGLDQEYLNKLHGIELNDHGINHNHVVECFKYLKTFYKGELRRRTQDRHYDLGHALKNCKPGSPCNSLMNPPVLCRGVMYPCCIHPGLELWGDSCGMRDSLIRAGWGLNNPKVADVLVNWKSKVPEYVVDQCSNHCWVPRRLKVNVSLKPITLKQNDVIKKGLY